MWYYFLSSKFMTKNTQMSNKKDRSKKQEQFKQKAKQEAAQQAIPKTHLVPVPTWQSDDNLNLRGDMLEALEQQLMTAIDAIQKCGQIAQFVMQQNIKAEKIKVNYVWNNGEPASEAEIATHKDTMKKLQEERQAQLLKMQEQIQQDHNAAITGLVGPDGQPVGTTQSLDYDDSTDGEQDSTGGEDESGDNAGGGESTDKTSGDQSTDDRQSSVD